MRAQLNSVWGVEACWLMTYICSGMEIVSQTRQIAKRRTKRDLFVLLLARSVVKLRR
jgi:hypothetical protein